MLHISIFFFLKRSYDIKSHKVSSIDFYKIKLVFITDNAKEQHTPGQTNSNLYYTIKQEN